MSSTSENLPPRTIARLVREVRDLQYLNNNITNKNKNDNCNDTSMEGIRLIVDSESGLPTNLGELMAEIEGPVGTPYEGKYFHLKLIFCQQFPAAPPRGFFITKIYHPNVDITTGAICVNTLKKDWTSTTTLSHVLNVVRCLLIVPFPESSLNDEAGKLFMESYEEYAKRARLMADVHGRKTSFAAENNANNNNNANTQGLDPRILKTSSSDNPLRTNNKLSTNTSSDSTTCKNNTAAKPSTSSSAGTKKVTNKKNKSLKRL